MDSGVGVVVRSTQPRSGYLWRGNSEWKMVIGEKEEWMCKDCRQLKQQHFYLQRGRLLLGNNSLLSF